MPTEPSRSSEPNLPARNERPSEAPVQMPRWSQLPRPGAGGPLAIEEAGSRVEIWEITARAVAIADLHGISTTRTRGLNERFVL